VAVARPWGVGAETEVAPSLTVGLPPLTANITPSRSGYRH